MATGAGALPPPVTLPTTSKRPGSAKFSDIYGPLGFGAGTASAGGEGAARAGDAARAGGAPITINGIGPDFLARPAGVLVVLLVLLAVWSYVDR
jgi:hypothetical protein